MTAHAQIDRPRVRTFAALRVLAAVLALSTLLAAQDARRQFALDTVGGLRLHNVTATPATLQGKAGITVAMSEEAQRQLQSKAPDPVVLPPLLRPARAPRAPLRSALS